MSTAVIVGLGMATVGVIGRTVIKNAPNVIKNLETKLASMPKANFESFTASFTDTKYYKGGFEQKMTKREAALILGVSPNAPKLKIKEAHKRIMILNHPDKGGSPYIATKLNEGISIIKILNQPLVKLTLNCFILSQRCFGGTQASKLDPNKLLFFSFT
jgi:hypothetical protein